MELRPGSFEESVEIVRQLKKLGFTVAQFNEYHCRVNGDFDFWLNARGRGLHWHDRFTGDRGIKPQDQIVNFIKVRLERESFDVTREEFMQRLMQIGWKYEEAEKSWKERQSSAKQE